MIDVPIAVRDALKDGGYKKNYRFVVGDVIKENVYVTVATLAEGEQFQIDRDGDYRIYNAYHNTGFSYGYSPDGSVWVALTVEHPQTDPDGGYYDEQLLTGLQVGSYVQLTDSPWGFSYEIQRKTNKLKDVYIPNYEINNNRLVKESVKIDERMCSDDTLKFGLCEGSSLEFQAFDIENLTGKRIKALVDVKFPVFTYDYDEETNITTRTETIETYTIPMGYFDVQESSRQASTGIRKISAYNKLKSDYLDQQANAMILEAFGTAPIRVIDIISFLLEQYGIKQYENSDISPSWGGGSSPSTSKKYFSPFKYSQTAYEDYRGFAFTPWALDDESTYDVRNKNMWLEGIGRHANWDTQPRWDTTPVQIKVDEYIEQIDTIIANYIQDQLAILETKSTGRTAAQMWDDLLHMKYVTKKSIYEPMNGYFFYVMVRVYNPQTGKTERRIYSNHHPDAVGTFAQLNRTTFLNVLAIQIVTPYAIRYGYKFDGEGWIKPHYGYNPITGEWNVLENLAKLTGNYPQDDPRTTPRLPNGSPIPDDIFSYFEVRTLTGGYSPAELIEVKPDQIQNVTLRDLQTAVFETECQFGKLDRVNNFFIGVELNNRRLYPADSLYPDDELYPVSTSESGFRAIYSKLWADEGNIRSWRNLIITYKGLIENEDTQEHEEAEKIYTAVVDANGTDDYDVTANWLFKNLLWADSESESWQEATGLENIEDYADAMVAKMQSVQWFPFEMWCAGLPYVETGDEVEIIVGEHAYTSYVLRRTIKGIQNLQDEMINGTLDIF